MIIKNRNLKGIKLLGNLGTKESFQARKECYDWDLIKKFPSKNSTRLFRYIIKTFTSPGDHVCDLMDGTGTTVVESIKLKRNAYSFNIYKKWLVGAIASVNKTRTIQPDCGMSKIFWLPGNMATEVLPRYFFKLVLFSPPYGIQNHSAGNSEKQLELLERKAIYSCQEYEAEEGWTDYDVSKSKNLNQFFDKMDELLCVAEDLLKPGGFLALVVQDYIRKGKPVELPQRFVDNVVSNCNRMIPFGYYNRGTKMTAFKSFQLTKGNNVIGDEQTLIFRKDK